MTMPTVMVAPATPTRGTGSDARRPDGDADVFGSALSAALDDGAVDVEQPTTGGRPDEPADPATGPAVDAAVAALAAAGAAAAAVAATVAATAAATVDADPSTVGTPAPLAGTAPLVAPGTTVAADTAPNGAAPALAPTGAVGPDGATVPGAANADPATAAAPGAPTAAPASTTGVPATAAPGTAATGAVPATAVTGAVPATTEPGTAPVEPGGTVPSTASDAATAPTDAAGQPGTGGGDAEQPGQPGQPAPTPVPATEAAELTGLAPATGTTTGLVTLPDGTTVNPAATLGSIAPAAPTAPTAPVTPTAAPAANPVPAPPASQVAMHIAPLRLEADGIHRLTVHLHPVDLGPVSIVAEIRNGAVHVQLAGATEAGRETLRHAMNDLRRELQESGFEKCSLDLRHDSPQDGQQARQQSTFATALRDVGGGVPSALVPEVTAPRPPAADGSVRRLDLHV